MWHLHITMWVSSSTRNTENFNHETCVMLLSKGVVEVKILTYLCG